MHAGIPGMKELQDHFPLTVKDGTAAKDEVILYKRIEKALLMLYNTLRYIYFSCLKGGCHAGRPVRDLHCNVRTML